MVSIEPEPSPDTTRRVDHPRGLLRRAGDAINDLTRPQGPEDIVIDAILLIFSILIAVKFAPDDLPTVRIAAAIYISVCGVSLLGGLYHYAIRRPRQRARRR